MLVALDMQRTTDCFRSPSLPCRKPVKSHFCHAYSLTVHAVLLTDTLRSGYTPKNGKRVLIRGSRSVRSRFSSEKLDRCNPLQSRTSDLLNMISRCFLFRCWASLLSARCWRRNQMQHLHWLFSFSAANPNFAELRNPGVAPG
jgi:hypothetical protein